MPTFEFTTTWREWQSDGVPDWKLGDLEQVSEAEKAGAKALTAAALNAVNLDGDHYDSEVAVTISIEQDPPAVSLTVGLASAEATPEAA